jgi:hypothetical protein
MQTLLYFLGIVNSRFIGHFEEGGKQIWEEPPGTAAAAVPGVIY